MNVRTNISVITFDSILVTIRIHFEYSLNKVFDLTTLTRRQVTLSKVSMTLTITIRLLFEYSLSKVFDSMTLTRRQMTLSKYR